MDNPSRKRADELAAKSLAAGDPTGWFEELYHSSGGDAGSIPWADGVPNPFLVTWAERVGLRGQDERALVTGCGLGDDAVFLAERGFAVTAFDIAPTAVEWARRLHPHRAIHWHVADLFAPPDEWRQAFALVVDVHTVQPLPPHLQPAAIAAIASFVAPGGRVVAVCRAREEHQEPTGPPWPLSPSVLRGYTANGLTERHLEHWLDETESPPQPRMLAVFERTV